MIDTETFGEQPVLRLDHVTVAVVRKFCPHPVARLARFAMPDVVGQNDEKFCCVEWLAGSEELAGELRPDELRTAPGCPVHDDYGVLRYAFRVSYGLSEGPVMQPQLRHSFTGGKLKVVRDEIVVVRRGIFRGAHRDRKEDRKEQNNRVSHRVRKEYRKVLRRPRQKRHPANKRTVIRSDAQDGASWRKIFSQR